MQNMTALRNELVDVYYKTKNKEITLTMGKELTNTAGKIIAAVRTQIAYNALQGIKEPIAFLEDKPVIPLSTKQLKVADIKQENRQHKKAR